MSIFPKFLLVMSGLMLGGCAINRDTANFDPNKDVVATDVFYVERFEPDQRHLNQTIADKISVRGYEVTAGETGQAPANTTVLVTYVDKWQWDITNYLIELTMTFRDPVSGAAIASGNSYHTSLSRLSPEEMIDEVLTNIIEADRTPAK
ncbi:MAG: hypothetical protein MUP90_15915 [Gammaproteobacteria bacterium]|nr:hypothetical protein [Gammaproteobacteria bacterium]